jgi:hypothetical protein
LKYSYKAKQLVIYALLYSKKSRTFAHINIQIMIKVYKDYDNFPRALLSLETEKAIQELLQKEYKYTSNIRNLDSGSRSDVINSLNTIYHHKCAYCETKTDLYRPLQT